MAIKGDFDMCISMDIKTLNELTKIFPNMKIIDLIEMIQLYGNNN